MAGKMFAWTAAAGLVLGYAAPVLANKFPMSVEVSQFLAPAEGVAFAVTMQGRSSAAIWRLDCAPAQGAMFPLSADAIPCAPPSRGVEPI